jgi:hypothetical protein
VLEDNPGDKRARSNLTVLRKEGSPEGIARLIETGRIERLYPGHRPVPRYVVPTSIVLAIAVAIYLVWPLGVSLVETASRPRAARPEVAAVTLSRSEMDSPVQTSGTFRYALTEKQAIDAFERAKDYFQTYRDNAAIKEIDRLLSSNASAALKEKAKSLRAFVGKPDFRTVRDAPSFAEAQRDPTLFDACSVVWKGMAANVRPDSRVGADARLGAGAGAVSFDFLVGYQDKKRLEGLVPARIIGSEVPVDRPLEILATLRSVDGSLSMDCIAIHELSQGTAP